MRAGLPAISKSAFIFFVIGFFLGEAGLINALIGLVYF
jgi:hypothetical protein